MTKILVADITDLVADLMDEVPPQERLNKLNKTKVSGAIIHLAEELTGLPVKEWDEDDLCKVNHTLKGLDIDPITYSFTLKVQVVLCVEVQIDVEAENLDEAVEDVHGGEYDLAIREAVGERDAKYLMIESYRDVEEA
jgi:hypothetical protein